MTTCACRSSARRTSPRVPRFPWDDPRCILCLKEKPLTKAHLIPEFLGGNLFAYNECKDCNSDLGSKVEAAIRKAPQIRLAAINLRDQLPGLEKRINDGQRYIAKQDDGTVVRFARKGTDFRLLNHSEPGNRILDDDSAMKSIRADLIRAGRSPEEADAFVAEIEAAPRDAIFQIDESTAIRRGSISHDKIAYRGDGELLEDRAAALIAYRFWALIDPQLALLPAFDPLRAWLRGQGPQPEFCRVEGKRHEYLPVHVLTLQPADEGTEIRVYLLGWLVPVVTLLGVTALHRVECELDILTGGMRGAAEQVAGRPS
jgi:hypothetical protein